MSDVKFIVTTDETGAIKGFKKVDEALDGVGKATAQSESKFKGLWKSIAGGVLVTQGLAMAMRGAKGLVGSFMDVATETETYRLRLETLLGSTEAAEKAFDIFRETAAKLPFTLQDITEAGMKISTVTDEYEKWLIPVADVAAAMGMTIPEAADQMTRSFSSGLGAADLFREKGVTQLIKEFARMKYGIDDVSKVALPQMRQIMYEAFTDVEYKFAGASEKLAGSWKGLVSMIQDKWYTFRDAVMNAGVFEFLKEGLGKFNEKLDELVKSGKLEEWAIRTARVIVSAFGVAGQSILTLLAVYNSAIGTVQGAIADVSGRLVTKQEETLERLLSKNQTERIKQRIEVLNSVIEHNRKSFDKYSEASDRYLESEIKLIETSAKLAGMLDRIKAGMDEAAGATKEHGDAQETAGGQTADAVGKVVEVTLEATRIAGDWQTKESKVLKNLQKAHEKYTDIVNELTMGEQEYKLWSLDQWYQSELSSLETSLATYEEYLAARLALDKAYAAKKKQTEEESQESWKEIFFRTIEDVRLVQDGIDAISAQAYENKMIELDNREAREKEIIENSIMTEEQKAEAFAEIDAKFDKERSSVRRKGAKEEKAVALFSAIINTAAAIVKALPSIPLSIAVGLLGAVQIALIASKPIPLARGGIVDRPLLIGEAGAELVYPARGMPALAQEIVKYSPSSTPAGGRGYGAGPALQATISRGDLHALAQAMSKRPIKIYIDGQELKATIVDSVKWGFKNKAIVVPAGAVE